MKSKTSLIRHPNEDLRAFVRAISADDANTVVGSPSGPPAPPDSLERYQARREALRRKYGQGDESNERA